MCLVSKVKFLCGRCCSPAVRLRQPKSNSRQGFTNIQNTIVTNQKQHSIESETKNGSISASTNDTNGKDLNLAISSVVDDLARKSIKTKGNKFTDGLDLSLTTDWASELRPSMRKLRQAMDGLLKTARLMHSVQRLQQDMKRTSSMLATMYRRDVCFSQSV